MASLTTVPTKIFRCFCFAIVFATASCNVYRQNVMFQTDGDVNEELLAASAAEAGRNYKIQPNDILDIKIFTNKGELLVDPNNFLRQELIGENSQALQQQRVEKPKYVVQPNGEVKVPMVGYVPVAGLTVAQVDSMLQARYETYYRGTYVYTDVASRRVIVLGATGGKVIPLTNESMNLVEVLALAGGISENGKAHNIRVIRNIGTEKPIVQVIDLSTISGMQRASLFIRPNDVVYVEPVRRVLTESMRDVLPILTAITSVITTFILVQNSVK